MRQQPFVLSVTTWSRSMNGRKSDMQSIRSLTLAITALLAACAVDAPPQYGQVVTMKASEAASREGYPPPGTVWRLDERDLKAMSPAPFVEPPPPPRLPPPPRPNDPAPEYYGPPYYAPSLYWGSGFYYWGR